MHQSLARCSAPVSFVRAPPWADFITTTVGFKVFGTHNIEQHADALGIPLPLVSALDKTMRAHNFSIAELEKDLRLPYAAEAKEIDVRQLAVIVCVADALEFSDTRVIDGVIDQIMLDPSAAARTSYRENMKHVCVG